MLQITIHNHAADRALARTVRDTSNKTNVCGYYANLEKIHIYKESVCGYYANHEKLLHLKRKRLWLLRKP